MAIIINRACKPRRRIRMELLSFWGTSIHTLHLPKEEGGREAKREREREDEESF